MKIIIRKLFRKWNYKNQYKQQYAICSILTIKSTEVCDVLSIILQVYLLAHGIQSNTILMSEHDSFWKSCCTTRIWQHCHIFFWINLNIFVIVCRIFIFLVLHIT